MAYDSTLGRLPDPTTNPLAPGFTVMGLSLVTSGMTHDLNDGTAISVIFGGGSYWQLNLSYPETTPEQFNALYPFLVGLKGGFKNFYLGLPNYKYPQTGEWPTQFGGTTNNLRLVSSDTFDILNWDAIQLTGVGLSPGDMIKFTNSPKIYMVSATAYIAGNGGKLTVNLSSDIVNSSTLSSASIEPNELRMKCRLMSSNLPEATLNNSGLYTGFSLAIRENIR